MMPMVFHCVRALGRDRRSGVGALSRRRGAAWGRVRGKAAAADSHGQRRVRRRARAADAGRESFGTRDAYLEDVPVADTVLVLQALAARRGMAAELESQLLPAGGARRC